MNAKYVALSLLESNSKHAHECMMRARHHWEQARHHELKASDYEDEKTFEPTHENYHRHLEASGKHEEAAYSYEKAHRAYRGKSPDADKFHTVAAVHADEAHAFEREHKLNEDLDEMSSVEAESNKEHLKRPPGSPQAGPDPKVQKELRLHGFLARVAKMRAKRGIHESRDESDFVRSAKKHFDGKHGTDISSGAVRAHLFGGDHPDHRRLMKHLGDDYYGDPDQIKDHFGLDGKDLHRIAKLGLSQGKRKRIHEGRAEEDSKFERTKRHLMSHGMPSHHIDRSADSDDEGQGSWVHVHHDYERDHKKIKGLHSAIVKDIKSGKLRHEVTDKGSLFRLKD